MCLSLRSTIARSKAVNENLGFVETRALSLLFEKKRGDIMEKKLNRTEIIEGLERIISIPYKSPNTVLGEIIISRHTAKTILELLKEPETAKEPETTKTEMIYGTYYCKSCKAPLLMTDKFCHECGKKLDWSSGFIHWGDNANHCVGCGDVIPEGRMVCPNCEVKE